LPRSARVSATPIQPTVAFLAAISPRIRPIRPAPTIASPIRFGDRPAAIGLRLLERQGDWGVAVGREICGERHLHHLPRLLGGYQERAVERDRLDEVNRLRLHRPLVDMA